MNLDPPTPFAGGVGGSGGLQGEREGGGGSLVVVLQCLLKLTRTHHGGKRGVGI